MRKLTLGLLKVTAGRFLAEVGHPALGYRPEPTEEDALAQRLRQDFGLFVAQCLAAEEVDLPAVSNGDDAIAFPALMTDFRVAVGSRLRLGNGCITGHGKIRGFDYSLLVLISWPVTQLPRIILIDQNRTADFQTTLGVRDIMRRNGNLDDLVAFLEERRIGLDDSDRMGIATSIISAPPRVGYLTHSLGDVPSVRFGHALKLIETGRADGLELITPPLHGGARRSEPASVFTNQ